MQLFRLLIYKQRFYWPFYSFVLFVLPMYGLLLMSLFFKSSLTTIYTRIAGWMDFFITRILPIILILIAITLFGYGVQIF